MNFLVQLSLGLRDRRVVVSFDHKLYSLDTLR